MKINETTLNILAKCRTEGNVLFLPEGQLDRAVYNDVNKVLTALGGKWNRKEKGHVFDYDPEEALETAIMTGEVVDKKKHGDGVYMHIVEVENGTFTDGEDVTLEVCKKNRMAVCRNHSTTHLLHKALKEVLGDHVAQAGSEVNANHLRFDFSHFEAMTDDQLRETEKKVNDAILEAMPVVVRELPIEEAKKLGAEAQFGEKYGDVVRVVSMGDYSVEFCGGTHLSNTAQAGLFKLLSESGVAAGTRRIEAVTGQGVLDYIEDKDNLIVRTAVALKTNLLNEIDKKAESLAAESRADKKALEELKAKAATGKLDDVMKNCKNVNGVDVIAAQVDGLAVNDMRTLCDSIRDKMSCGVAVLASNNDGKLMFIAMATKDALSKGVHAGNIIKEVTKIAGGSGGGKPDMAQGGGKDASKTADALDAVESIVESQVK